MLLKKGDTGFNVKSLQQHLITFGYSCGSCGADGIFGEDTHVAVVKFQRDHSLAVDGIAGSKTLGVIANYLKTNTGTNYNVNIIETNLQLDNLNYSNKPNMIILHHSQHKTWNVYDIHNFHKNEKGWSGIGYHFFITKDGKIYRGRPEKAIGAHCLHHNTNTLGICVQGNYMIETTPKAQVEAVIALCKYLCSKYTINSVKVHKELGDTDCPGANYPANSIKNSI